MIESVPIENDLWSMVYDLCVRTPKWLELTPFQAGRLSIDVIKETKDRDGFLQLVNKFRRILSLKSIDFEKSPLLKTYPEVKNEHVYTCLRKHIEYFERYLHVTDIFS